MQFPVSSVDLNGLHVLLILIARDRLRDAFFFTGIAHFDGSHLRLLAAKVAVPPVSVSSEALSGFDPRVLPVLMDRDSYAKIEPLLSGIEAAIVLFSDDSPSTGLELSEPFFGLAADAMGRPLLMQGNPDLATKVRRQSPRG